MNKTTALPAADQPRYSLFHQPGVHHPVPVPTGPSTAVVLMARSIVAAEALVLLVVDTVVAAALPVVAGVVVPAAVADTQSG